MRRAFVALCLVVLTAPVLAGPGGAGAIGDRDGCDPEEEGETGDSFEGAVHVDPPVFCAGSIRHPEENPEDWYRFTVSEGDWVLLVLRTDGDAQTGNPPTLRLWNPMGHPVAVAPPLPGGLLPCLESSCLWRVVHQAEFGGPWRAQVAAFFDDPEPTAHDYKLGVKVLRG